MIFKKFFYSVLFFTSFFMSSYSSGAHPCKVVALDKACTKAKQSATRDKKRIIHSGRKGEGDVNPSVRERKICQVAQDETVACCKEPLSCLGPKSIAKYKGIVDAAAKWGAIGAAGLAALADKDLYQMCKNIQYVTAASAAVTLTAIANCKIKQSDCVYSCDEKNMNQLCGAEYTAKQAECTTYYNANAGTPHPTAIAALKAYLAEHQAWGGKQAALVKKKLVTKETCKAEDASWALMVKDGLQLGTAAISAELCKEKSLGVKNEEHCRQIGGSWNSGRSLCTYAENDPEDPPPIKICAQQVGVECKGTGGGTGGVQPVEEQPVEAWRVVFTPDTPDLESNNPYVATSSDTSSTGGGGEEEDGGAGTGGGGNPLNMPTGSSVGESEASSNDNREIAGKDQGKIVGGGGGNDDASKAADGDSKNKEEVDSSGLIANQGGKGGSYSSGGGTGGGGSKWGFNNKFTQASLDKKQLKEGEAKMSDPLGASGIHQNIFERISIRFKKLCSNKHGCRLKESL